MSDSDFLNFKFLKIEEKPLLAPLQTWILNIFGFLILGFGLLTQVRIYVMLHKEKREGTVIVINKLFKVHNIFNMFCHSAILIYLLCTYNLFPMVDYIGLTGCLFFPHFLSAFTTLYCLIFPVTITILRYMLGVHSSKTKNIGINKLVNMIGSTPACGPRDQISNPAWGKLV